jgi:hypothetical protein
MASEAALPGQHFNEATRDRRFFSRLAVPLLPGIGRTQRQGISRSRALSGPPSSPRTRPDRRRATVMAPGEVAEWSNAPHSKCGIGASLSGVRIPPSPPVFRKTRKMRLSADPRFGMRSSIGHFSVQGAAQRTSQAMVSGPAGPGSPRRGACSMQVERLSGTPLTLVRVKRLALVD